MREDIQHPSHEREIHARPSTPLDSLSCLGPSIAESPGSHRGLVDSLCSRLGCVQTEEYMKQHLRMAVWANDYFFLLGTLLKNEYPYFRASSLYTSNTGIYRSFGRCCSISLGHGKGSQERVATRSLGSPLRGVDDLSLRRLRYRNGSRQELSRHLMQCER